MVQLELAPEVEERLRQAAAGRGLKPEAYVVQLIEAAVSQSLPEKHLTEEQLRAFLDGMASLGRDLPILPDYAYTRESFYEDHD
jgi:hypothetical protein